MRKSRINGGLAVASAATLVSLSCGVLVGSAAANPGPDHENYGKHENHGKHRGQDQHEDTGQTTGTGKSDGQHGHDNGHAHAPGQQADQNGGQVGVGPASDHGDPAGNNGTVKIAGPGDAVGHPSNSPHPGCTFFVEWFGFDQGEDVVSTVDFAAQAPTGDVAIGGTSPAQVLVGADPAGGGTDLDGRQAYTLTFSGGEPHPKQGYHVKLTVATPHSLGNDTKTKVFWVAPCEDDTTGTGTGASSHHAATSGGHAHRDRGVEAESVTLSSADTSDDVSRASSAGTAAVPTEVDAGEDGSVLAEWARSPLPLAAVAGGLTLVAAGMVRRNRSRA